MPKPGTSNILFVLENGDPNEWALARDVPTGDYAGVRVWRFDNVPDEVADEIEEYREVQCVWGDLMELKYKQL